MKQDESAEGKRQPDANGEIDDLGELIDESDRKAHQHFHGESKIKELKRKKEFESFQLKEKNIFQIKKSEEAPPSPGFPEGASRLRPDEASVECRVKKAVVAVGALTGFVFSDRIFRNTAEEAVRDLNNRGYLTALLDQPTSAQIKGFIVDPCVKAFCYIGHGSDEDSKTGVPGEPGGADFMWPNENEVITSAEIKFWMNQGRLDALILHACFQGAVNNAARWKEAFGLQDADFFAFKKRARGPISFWWQMFWS